MKLGLLADIHEHVDYLSAGLDRFAAEGVDQVIVLGDVFEMGRQIAETCELLSNVGAIGVWGNHDFGLCVSPDEESRLKYGDAAIKFMTSLHPRLELPDCYFAHIEPWLNPEKLEDLWFFDKPIDRPGNLERLFGSVPHRLMFAGHYHRWMLVQPTGVVEWDGLSSLDLTDGRYFVVVGAVCAGHCALLDTDTWQFTPVVLAEHASV